jgi:hypothetical protein
MVTRMPRFLSESRNLRLLYPLSPTTRLGRRLGRPRLARFTAPWSNNCSAAVASWRWPGVSTKVIKCPLPATRTWILVLNPPRLRPNASASAQLFSPRRRADGHARLSHPQSGFPSQPYPPRRLAAEALTIPDPRCPLFASVESDYTHSATSHSAPAGLATALPSAQSIRSHSPSCDGHSPGDLPRLSAEATMASIVPTAHRSVHVVGSCVPV